MTKIKCVKLECPVCHKVGSCQLFFNNKDEVRYCRVRHYIGVNELGKPQFKYHKINDLLLVKTLYENQGYQFKTAKVHDGSTQGLTKYGDLNVKGLGSIQKSRCLGSLAWWGTALVRRWSRDQSPPEAPFQIFGKNFGLKRKFFNLYILEFYFAFRVKILFRLSIFLY